MKRTKGTSWVGIRGMCWAKPETHMAQSRGSRVPSFRWSAGVYRPRLRDLAHLALRWEPLLHGRFVFGVVIFFLGFTVFTPWFLVGNEGIRALYTPFKGLYRVPHSLIPYKEPASLSLNLFHFRYMSQHGLTNLGRSRKALVGIDVECCNRI